MSHNHPPLYGSFVLGGYMLIKTTSESVVYGDELALGSHSDWTL